MEILALTGKVYMFIVFVLQMATALQVHNVYKHLVDSFSSVPDESPFMRRLEDIVSYLTNNSNSKDLFEFEPDFYRDVCELITSKGYPCEKHWVTTQDGFILGLHRIPYGVKNKTKARSGRPVTFLQHGLVEDASSFVNNLANESLAFILADAGADVWLGNMRGNMYSQNHINLSVWSSQFWNWSFDEMARYDLPAMLHYVSGQVDGAKIFYVGHSQGSCTAIIQLSRDPSLGQLLRYHFALAPATRVTITAGADKTFADFSDILYFVLYVFQHGPTSLTVPTLPPRLCHVIGDGLCLEFLFSLTGANYASFNLTRLPVYLSNFPQPTSLNNLLHWLQLIKSGKFQYFDEGSPADNRKRYGQDIPPVYDLSAYDVPTTIFYGGHDNFIQEADIWWLRDQIRATKTVYIPEYEHQDFVWGIDAATSTYTHIVEAITKQGESQL